MKTKLSSKGQIVLPAALREQDGIEPGQQFEVERVEEGQYLLTKVPSASPGFLDWLLACPEKGWFQPLPFVSDSTDSLGKGLFEDEP
jgi:AbrB family looped-hinge helix DNA binding protein